ncbi:alpha/beta fold hydrolase [Streptomyces spectabilis]|uniref:Alpha/beta fold hydrolase n=1 Tax=Streptomyces spectabilis TaxID=68270 RepID=A0A5P2XKR4_STRST|nr:alpha/beta fold hydrolase [Streptomyces spectabilis]MBB5102101.1 pimeloyl-ACP methyl ester carboxylesterase [Streptomyces spectabilis]MCI3907151.1 alpha/beta hydrolase [Streptomyces spectabilis]QEV63909.1 alpha/beta fold hydrolase [Streptomyces spectabilis]GGV28769.1 peptidase [Streptomyces spectabilis]
MTYKNKARRAGLAVGVLAVLASVLPTAAATATTAAPASAAAVPSGWCPSVPGHEVDCGQEKRPLVAGKPQLGAVKVSYAVVRHRAPGPAKGTVALNPGGPGETLIDKAKEVTWALEGLLKDHDVLLVDPRGTGKSERVPCGVTDAEYRFGTRAQQRAAVERCGKNLGPKAAGFTSAATADDIDAIRARLKVRKLSLYGLSYGTYLMPVYASRHPESVRNIVLSGAYPLALDTMARPSAQAVSLTLRRVCERSVPVACDGEQTVRDLATTAARLRAEPLTIPIATGHGVYKKKFTEDKLANLLFEAASSGVGFEPDKPSLLGQLPHALNRFVKGDTAPLRELVRAEGESGSELDQAPYIAVVCNDYRRDWSKDASRSERWRQYRAALAAVRPGEHGAFSAKGFTEGTTDAGDVCIGWPGKDTPNPQPTKPKLPNVPVLVLSGDLDSNTPDASGKKAAGQFRDSRFHSVRNMGHVPELELSRCVAGVSSRFIRANDPGDTSCLRSLPPIAVTPVRR